MINHHRIARQAAGDITRREAVRRASDARAEQVRANALARAEEEFPPRTAAAKAAVLDLHRSRLIPGRLEEIVHRRYGVTIARFQQVVVQLMRDPEAYAARAGECKRLDRIVSRPRELRARARALRAAGGAA